MCHHLRQAQCQLHHPGEDGAKEHGRLCLVHHLSEVGVQTLKQRWSIVRSTVLCSRTRQSPGSVLHIGPQLGLAAGVAHSKDSHKQEPNWVINQLMPSYRHQSEYGMFSFGIELLTTMGYSIWPLSI